MQAHTDDLWNGTPTDCGTSHRKNCNMQERRLRHLDGNPAMREQFELGYDIERIVSAIQFETG